MQLTGLEPLYNSMIEQGLQRVKFSITINKAVFSIIYIIDSTPHALAIGVRNKNLFFEVAVKKGFIINPYLGDKYGDICEALGLTSSPSQPFSPKKFYEEINSKIPNTTSPRQLPKPRDFAPYRKDVEEPEKIYFYDWRDNTIRGEKVRPKNLAKTKQWLSEEAYKMCKTYNISSCWTADPSKEKEFTLPR